MRIDDERDLHGQLEAAFEAITPRPAPVDGAVRRGRAVRVRRRVAVAAGAAAVVAIGVFAVPSLLHQTASPAPVSPARPYTVTVQAPGPHSAPGLIASGTIDGQSWQLTAARPGTGVPEPGGQMFTTSGPAFGGAATSWVAAALAVDSADPVSFSDISGSVLTPGDAQVQYGAVRADVTYVAVRLGNGTVLILHPVAVYGVRAVAFAVPVGAGIVGAAAYSRHGEIAAATPFTAPNGVAAFGVWLTPGQHGLARASGRIGSGTANGRAWSVTAYLGPWGICYQAPATGLTWAYCVPTTSDLDRNSGTLSLTGGGVAVAAGHAPASAAWVIVNQPDGTTTKVCPVTVGAQKLFAFQLQTGPDPLSWTAYDSSGHVVRWRPADPRAPVAGTGSAAGRGRQYQSGWAAEKVAGGAGVGHRVGVVDVEDQDKVERVGAGGQGFGQDAVAPDVLEGDAALVPAEVVGEVAGGDRPAARPAST